MMATYRGTTVSTIQYNAALDTYSLFAEDGSTIAELLRHEYLSHHQLRSMKINGRHRGAAAKNNRRAGGVAGQAGRDDTLDATLYSRINAGPVYTGPARTGRSPVSIGTMLDAMAEKPKPPLKRDGIIAGEIVGYRCWRVEKGLLRSVYQNDIWQPGQVLEGRELGDWDSRGIHAWKDAGSKHYHDYIRSYLNQEDDPFRKFFVYFGPRGIETEPRETRPAMVTGTVFLWGDVVEHERGWRAEFARVRTLDWLYPDATMMGRERAALEELRRRYLISDVR